MQQRYETPWLASSAFALDWNGPVERAFAPFADADLETPVFALFARAAKAHGDRIAVDDGTLRLTYKDALRRVRALAARIADATKPNELVGILLPTSGEFTLAMLACFAAGRVFVPLDLHYPKTWIGNVVEDAGMAAIVGRFDVPETAALVPDSIRRIDLAAPEATSPFMATPAGPDAPAFVLFTSGSTGRPKGIVNSQRAIARRVQQYVNAAHVNADDRFLPLSSECTIAGLRERITALMTGATLYLVDVQRAGLRQILRVMAEAQITMIYAVPALLRSLIALEDPDSAKSLRVVRVGGDAVLWSDVALLRGWLSETCLIELGYSSTEAPIMQWFVPRDFPQEGTKIPIGYPLAGNALAILNDQNLPVASGEVGELVVNSPYVALGRWIGGRCVGDDFPSDPSNPNSRALHTGDLARLRSDGFVELVGRKDRQLKINGVRIEPGEIEAALRLSPDVQDAAIFARRTDQSIRLIAYVVPKASATGDVVATLKAFLKARLAPQLQPHRIHVVSEIPRLPSAKLDAAALEALDRAKREEEAEPAATSAAQADAQTIEGKLAAIWCELLDRPSIDRDADFFDLGGDSLMTLSLMFAIEDALGVELPVTMIYHAPTIASLAAAIEKHSEPEFSPLVLIKDGKGTSPLFICHGVGGNVMELFALGRRIETDSPVYAIQAKGLDGREEPNSSVAAMADCYLAAIRAVQPEGPYMLAGYSSGGLVAFEMAQRLKAEGETIGLLALFDTQTNARQWPLSIWARVFSRRAAHHWREFIALPLEKKRGYAQSVARALWRRIFWRLGATDVDTGATLSIRVPPALEKVFAASYAAVANYTPRFYDGRATLFVATARDPLMAEPERIWAPCVARLDTVLVPGDHKTMLDSAMIARALSERLIRRPSSP
jgi:amino acid adenylation domain-containing protein